MTERPYQHRNCDGSWGPLIINGKQVMYEGYPDKPAPQTVVTMKKYDDLYDDVYLNKSNSQINTEIKNHNIHSQNVVINKPEIICKETEDCMGNRYIERGYYERTTNGGYKWIDCGSGYNVHQM